MARLTGLEGSSQPKLERKPSFSQLRECLQQWQVGAVPACNIWKGFLFLTQASLSQPVKGTLLQALLRMVCVWNTIRQKNQWNERSILKYVIYFPDSEVNNFRISTPHDAKCSVKSFMNILRYELTS